MAGGGGVTREWGCQGGQSRCACMRGRRHVQGCEDMEEGEYVSEGEVGRNRCLTNLPVKHVCLHSPEFLSGFSFQPLDLTTPCCAK